MGMKRGPIAKCKTCGKPVAARGFVYCEKHLEQHQAMHQKLKWGTQTSLMIVLTREGKQLAVNAAPAGDNWAVVALEGPAGDINAVFEQHAHKLLGSFPVLAQAILVAEDFARKWLSGKSFDEPECPCDEIGRAFTPTGNVDVGYDGPVAGISAVTQQDLHDDHTPQCTGTLVHGEFDTCPVHDR